MSSRPEIISRLTDPGVIAVVRAQSEHQVLPLAEALLAGGIIAVEITMTTPNAIAAIRAAKQRLGPQALLGVGTVLDVSTCQQALEAGAEFIVSPILRPELVPVAHAGNRPVMLGAYTPTEAQIAYEAAADFVKIFPADSLGPNYIKALRAPLPHLRIVPTGGIELSNAEQFLHAGCAALGVGSSLVSSAILRDAKWPELTALAAQWVTTVREARLRSALQPATFLGSAGSSPSVKLS
jgi:2-dehydro-3-deoxyphosphogluconate aldolase/(4S)-4-hydroxy-2-oxoglutarate aldolase